MILEFTSSIRNLNQVVDQIEFYNDVFLVNITLVNYNSQETYSPLSNNINYILGYHSR
jgi:hypothetical protein